MIKLNKLAAELWTVTEEQKKIGRDSSVASILLRISASWRKLYSRCRTDPTSHIVYVDGKDLVGASKEKTYSQTEIEAADMILDSLNLLSLVKCQNVENLLRMRIVQRGGRRHKIYKL